MLSFWLGRKGSNLRMTESKSVALPLGDSPMMGRSMGIEPTNAGATIRCVHHFATTAIRLATQEGFEPPTNRLEGGCSIQLSY
jgi:hypothetical protein